MQIIIINTYSYMPEETQETVYNNSVQPIICKLFEGYNVTILAYGYDQFQLAGSFA